MGEDLSYGALTFVYHPSCTEKCPSDCSNEWKHVRPSEEDIDIKVACGKNVLFH